MHERADTAKENISARRRFPATNVPEVRRHGGAVLGRIRRPPRGVKTRSRQKPRNDATHGADADGAPGETGRLLELHLGAGAFELLLGLVGVLLGHLLEDRLRGGLDELLRLLEPEAREGPDLLDDLDLLAPGLGEDDVELVLLLGGLCCRRAGSGTCNRDGRGGGHVELLLERLEELVELEDAHALEDVQQLLGAELGCHGDYSSCSEDSEESEDSVEAAGSEAAR